MKKLWILAVFALCGSLAFAQLAHAFTTESASCDTLKTEQHYEGSVEKKSSDDATPKDAATESCCESCHFNVVNVPSIPVEKTAVRSESFAVLSAPMRGVFPETLSEPPQA